MPINKEGKLFKSLNAVVFMMVAGCASETAGNDQITDSVTQTPAPAASVDATSPAADVTVTVTGESTVTTPVTTCVDGSTPVDGVCPQVGSTSTTVTH
jgi:hypothetical protein